MIWNARSTVDAGRSIHGRCPLPRQEPPLPWSHTRLGQCPLAKKHDMEMTCLMWVRCGKRSDSKTGPAKAAAIVAPATFCKLALAGGQGRQENDAQEQEHNDDQESLDQYCAQSAHGLGTGGLGVKMNYKSMDQSKN